MKMQQCAKILKLIGGVKVIHINYYTYWIEPELRTKAIFVREAILEKDGKEIKRRLEFQFLQEAREIKVGEVVDLKKTSFSEKTQSMMNMDFERYSEIHDVYTELQDVAFTEIKLKAGDKCKIINPYGIVDGPYEIKGFIYQNQFGKMMILDWPTPWVFASVKGLRIKKGERWVEVKGIEIIPKDVNQEFWGEHIYVRPNHP